jgi:potassium efflux system protein
MPSGTDPLHQVVTVVGILTAAVAGQWGVWRLQRRLPLYLTRRFRDARATHPDPAIGRAVGLGLLPLSLGIWLLAGWVISERSPTFHAVRHVVAGAVRMAATMPLFELQDRPFSLLDLLALPVLLALVWAAMGVIVRLLQSRVLGAAGVERGAQETLATLFRLGGTALGGLLLLQTWGVDVRSLALVVSVLGVGIGFGLQHLANNLVSGLVIGLERPVKPGDFVRLGDLQGTVERVGARCVEIITPDRVSILVPNSHLLEQPLVNWSHRDPICRLHVPVGVAYGSDVHAVRAALLEAASRHPDVLSDPRPGVAFRGFGDSALLFELEVWTRRPARQRELVSDLNYRIEAALRRQRVTVPFPQRDLHLRSPDLSAIALAFARRHLGDAELDAARAALGPPGPQFDPGDGDLATETVRRSWDERELETLVARLRGASGLDIGDRRHRFTTYPRCFVGREAVDWLVQREAFTRDEAVRLGQLLLERDVIHHVLDEHPFRDADLFYRFRADDPPHPGWPASRDDGGPPPRRPAR